MGVLGGTETGRGGKIQCPRSPQGQTASPFSHVPIKGAISSTWLWGVTDRSGGRETEQKAEGRSPRPAGLTRASVSPSGMLADGREVDVKRRERRGIGKMGREEEKAVAAGWCGGRRGAGTGARTGAVCRGASQAHMRMHLPLMRSVLFCLLERFPSMLRLMFRRVSSVSSSWKSSLTL